jgi:hypothetical protein
MKYVLIKWAVCGVAGLVSFSFGYAQGDESIKSIHLGLLYPNGVDVAGYSVEKQISTDVYRFTLSDFHPWPPLVLVTVGISGAMDLPVRWA